MHKDKEGKRKGNLTSEMKEIYSLKNWETNIFACAHMYVIRIDDRPGTKIFKACLNTNWRPLAYNTTRVGLRDDYEWTSSKGTPLLREITDNQNLVMFVHNPSLILLSSARPFLRCVAKRVGAKHCKKWLYLEVTPTPQETVVCFLQAKIPIFANKQLHRLCLVNLNSFSEIQSQHGEIFSKKCGIPFLTQCLCEPWVCFHVYGEALDVSKR